MRTVILAVTILILCPGPVGCSSEVDEARDELGIKEGPRPVPDVVTKPPGPPDGSVQPERKVPGTGDSGGEDQGQDQD